MSLIGYARVSTGEQTLDPQRMELSAAGCTTIHEEHASGADRTRPALARLLASIRPGQTLVVVRLARSLSHLLQVIETLEAKGVHFRSLGDPIDTTPAQGKFSLQVMGAVAELERALIRERTKAGLRATRAQGRIGGNPALKAGDREAIRKLRAARNETYFQKLESTADAWLPLLRRNRPEMVWDDGTRLLGARTSQSWTVERLKRTARRRIRDGLLATAWAAPAAMRVSLYLQNRPRDTDRLIKPFLGAGNLFSLAQPYRACSQPSPSTEPCTWRVASSPTPAIFSRSSGRSGPTPLPHTSRGPLDF